MNDQQSVSKTVQESELVPAKPDMEIANMDETDWMAMLMEMRIVST